MYNGRRQSQPAGSGRASAQRSHPCSGLHVPWFPSFLIARAFPHANLKLRAQDSRNGPASGIRVIEKEFRQDGPPKGGYKPINYKGIFPNRGAYAAFRLSLSCRLISVLRAGSNGCAWNNLGRYDLRICTNCSRQSQDQVILNAFRGQPLPAKFHVAYSTLQ